MNRPEPADEPVDDIDRRFVELMSAEFVTRSQARPFDPPHVHDDGSYDEGHGAETFSLDAFWEHFDDDWYPYPDAEVVEAQRWSMPTLLGFLLFTGGLLACLVMLLLVPAPMPWPQVAAGAAVAGLALLLWQAFRRAPDTRTDDGARV